MMIFMLFVVTLVTVVTALGRRISVRRQDGIENMESGCAGCFWEERCNSEGGVKLCEDDTAEWEEAPWVMF